MRALAFGLAAAVVLLSFAAPPAAATPAEAAAGPICPLIASFATVCVGGSDCLLSVRLMGGDRLCA